MKILKFTDNLAREILLGEKDSTWRLFDDKDLSVGDELLLVNKDTGKEFAHAAILSVREMPLGKLVGSDFEDHKRYASEEEMYETYRGYYGDRVTPQSMLKMIKFKTK